MTVASEAQEAWWPPTFSPSRLGRRWLALWIVQARQPQHLALELAQEPADVWTGASVVMGTGIRLAPGKVLAFGPFTALYRVELRQK